MIVGAILAGSNLMVVGWIIFIIGLALNAMALVVLANREYLRQAQRVGVVPKASTSHPHGEITDATEEQPVVAEEQVKPTRKSRKGVITDSNSIFPRSK